MFVASPGQVVCGLFLLSFVGESCQSEYRLLSLWCNTPMFTICSTVNRFWTTWEHHLAKGLRDDPDWCSVCSFISCSFSIFSSSFFFITIIQVRNFNMFESDVEKGSQAKENTTVFAFIHKIIMIFCVKQSFKLGLISMADMLDWIAGQYIMLTDSSD